MANSEQLLDLLALQLGTLTIPVEAQAESPVTESEDAAEVPTVRLYTAAADLAQAINDMRHWHNFNGASWTYNTSMSNLCGLVTSPIADGARFHVCELRQVMKPVCAKYPRLEVMDKQGTLGISKQNLEDIKQELYVLSYEPIQSHENIVNLLGLGWMSVGPQGELCLPVLFMELSTLGSLSAFLRSNDIKARSRMKLVRDVGQGLSALHLAGIFHGDLKPDNVLVFIQQDGTFTAKIADFGSAILLTEMSNAADEGWAHRVIHKPRGGSALWNAPEWRKNLEVSGLEALDCYSFGLLTWSVLIGGGSPFGSMSLDEIEKIKWQGAVVLYANRSVREHYEFESSMWGQALRDEDQYELYMISVAMPREVFHATLSLEPSNRSLFKAVKALSWDELYGFTVIGSSKTLEKDFPKILIRHEAVNKYNRLSDAPKGLRGILLDKLRASALDQSYPGTDRGLSCLQIALAMIDGFGGSIDVVGALDWLMKSGELECVAAHGVAYNIFDAFKHLVPPRISDTEQRLLKWLRNAASHGSPLALRTLRQVDIVAFCAAKSKAMARFHLPLALLDQIAPTQDVEFLFSERGWEQLQKQLEPYPLTNLMLNKWGDKVLHFGAAYGVELERFVDYLNKFKPDVDEQNANEDTALLLAMQSGHSGHARVLLQYGAKADIPNTLGQLPSHWIIHVDEVEIIEELLDLLIQRRADLSKIAERNDVDQVSHYSMIPWVGPVLHWAVLEAREDIVPILLGKGADPLQHYNGMTALHLAIKMNEHAILRHILKHIELPLPTRLPFSGSRRVDSSCSSTSSWIVCSMSMAYHWHVLHHGSKAKSAFFRTLDELRNAGILGSDICYGLSWAIVSLPPDYTRSFLQFLGNSASVELIAEALDAATSQADPLVVSVVVEKILEIAPSDVRMLKKVFFALTKSLMPASSAIESLLSVLGDVDIRNDDGDTAFASAIHGGNFVMAAEYLRLGANENVLLPARNSESNKFEVNVLHYLIALNNDSAVSALRFLLEPQRPNQVKPNFIVCQNLGFTALHVSCFWDNIAIFQILIQHFGDEESINATCKTGRTALHYSAHAGILEKVKALCELGANVNAKTEHGFTPRDLCQTVHLWDSKGTYRTLEFWETMLISRLDIDEFLAKRGGKYRRRLLPNAFKFLIHAVRTGKPRLFDKALKLTPEHCKSREHLDAFLFLAARQGHHEIVQKLIREGAAISCASKSSITPLHVAAANGHVKTARVLVNSGAALYAKDKLGSSPIMVAHFRDHRHLVRYFHSSIY